MAGDTYLGGDDIVLTNFYQGLGRTYTNNQARQQEALNKQRLQQAKDLEEAQKSLKTVIDKVNTTGVQRIDLSEVTEKVDGMMQTYYEASKLTDKKSVLEKDFELRRKINELNQLIHSSKERGSSFIKLSEDYAKNPWLYPSDFKSKLDAMANTPTSKLGENALLSSAYLQPDTAYISKVNEDAVKSAWNRSNSTTTLGKTVARGVYGDTSTETIETKTLNADVLSSSIISAYQNDMKYKSLVDFQAKQLEVAPQDYLASKIQELLDNNTPVTKQGLIGSGRQSESNARGDDGYVVETDFTHNFGEKSSTTAKVYVGLNTGFNLTAGTFSLQTADGQSVKTNNLAEKFQVIGLGLYPVIKSGMKDRSGKPIKAGTIATTKFAENNKHAIEYQERAIVAQQTLEGKPLAGTTIYFAKPNEVIPRGKLTKGQKTAESAFREKVNAIKTSQTKPQQTKPQTKPQFN